MINNAKFLIVNFLLYLLIICY